MARFRVEGTSRVGANRGVVNPRGELILLAPVIAAAGYGLGLVLFNHFRDGNPLAINAHLTVFAALVVIALALERVIEPFTPLLPKDTEEVKVERDRAIRDVPVMQAMLVKYPGDEGPFQKALDTVAVTQAEVDKVRFERAVLTWGWATALGSIAAGASGLLLLSTVAGGSNPPASIDLLVTGLAIGAATKPIHDILSRLSRRPGTPPGVER